MTELAVRFSILAALLLFASTILAIAQDISKEDTDGNIRYILRKASKVKCFNKNENYKILVIYWFDFHKSKMKEPLTDESFMNSLELIKGPRKKKWSRNDMIVYNNRGKEIMSAENLSVFCNHRKEHSGMHDGPLDYFLERKPEMLFKISGTLGNLYFSKTGGKLKVLEFDENRVIERSFEEYRNCCWDSFIPLFLQD